MAAGAAGPKMAAEIAGAAPLALPDLAGLRAAVDAQLAGLVPASGPGPQRLYEAMRACVLSPGRRFRPCLTLLVARRCGADMQAAMEAGCAGEMVHAASLAIDDLPSMDDAALRRGRPALHRVHGEATALLAAISVLNLAYGTVARIDGIPAGTRTHLLSLFAAAIGPDGLAGGAGRRMLRQPFRGPASPSGSLRRCARPRFPDPR